MASAFARKNRVREWCSAPSAEKNTKRRAPARSAARTSRSVATALSSSIEARGWSRIDAARWITVCTPRSALRNERRIGQVAERDLHPYPVVAQPARIAHEAANRLPRRS